MKAVNRSWDGMTTRAGCGPDSIARRRSSCWPTASCDGKSGINANKPLGRRVVPATLFPPRQDRRQLSLEEIHRQIVDALWEMIVEQRIQQEIAQLQYPMLN